MFIIHWLQRAVKKRDLVKKKFFPFITTHNRVKTFWQGESNFDVDLNLNMVTQFLKGLTERQLSVKITAFYFPCKKFFTFKKDNNCFLHFSSSRYFLKNDTRISAKLTRLSFASLFYRCIFNLIAQHFNMPKTF